MKFATIKIAVIPIAMLLLLLTAGAALAQEADPSTPTDNEVNAIAKQLYCPVCENVPLDVCPTTACAQWRSLIREKLAQGWSDAEIKGYFVQQYGDRVLATPPAHGINWLVYLVPPAAIIAGAYILFRALRAWYQPASDSANVESTHAPNDEYAARLEEELSRR